MKFPGRRKYKHKSRSKPQQRLITTGSPVLDKLLSDIKPGDMSKMGALVDAPLQAAAARSMLLRGIVHHGRRVEASEDSVLKPFLVKATLNHMQGQLNDAVDKAFSNKDK